MININNEDMNQDDIGYNNLDEENNLEEEQVQSVEFENLEDVPDTLLGDLTDAIGTIINESEKSMLEDDPKMAKDAIIAKVAVNQKNVAGELHTAAQKTNKLKSASTQTQTESSNNNLSNQEGEIEGLDKSVTRSDIKKILDECLPCLDRPELAGAYKSAVAEMFKMFYQLVGMFDIFKDCLSNLIPPKNAYSFICDLLNALRIICVPDLMRLLILIKWYIGDLYLARLRKFSFVIDINLDLIFIPFYAALEVLIIGIIDSLLVPVQCIVNSFKVQAKKLVGKREKEFKVENVMVNLSNKLEEALKSAQSKLTDARHDWNVFMCQIGMQIKQVLNIISNISELLSIFSIIKSLIDLKQTIENCDNRNTNVNSLIKDIYDVEITNNNDIVIKPPIIINDNEQNIIEDIKDTFNEIHSGSKATNNDGKTVTYNDISEYVNNLFDNTNNNNIANMNSEYASTTTNMYRNADMDNILDTLELFTNKNVTKLNDKDNITNDNNDIYIKVGEVKDCFGDN